ncbi:MAG: hypothetical protein M1570_18290 [Chloroflexi bacterium]|nr:hypothetical protein [Chloroflexota bacterium]
MAEGTPQSARDLRFAPSRQKAESRGAEERRSGGAAPQGTRGLREGQRSQFPPSSFIPAEAARSSDPHPSSFAGRRGELIILVLTLVAFILRVYQLDFVSLRGDEAFTVLFVQRTWDGMWKGIRLVEPNPPLMYLALRVWIALAGASEFATRFFSVFFGVLCVPLVYRLGREMFRPKGRVSPRNLVSQPRLIPLLAAALITINPYQIWHSQDVRNYTMWPALSLLSLVFFWRWINQTTEDRQQITEGGRQKAVGREQEAGNSQSSLRPPDHATTGLVNHPTTELSNYPTTPLPSFIPFPSSLLLYVVATAASLYTHYYDTFILVAVNLFVFLTLWRQWKPLATWIAGQIVLALVYLPWVLFFTNRVTTYGEASAQQSVSLIDVFSRTLSTFVLGDTVPELAKRILWIPLALAAGTALIYLLRRSMTQGLFLLLYIAVPTLALYLISLSRPLFLERYLNAIAPAYYLAFAAGIAALWPSRSSAPAAAHHPPRFTWAVGWMAPLLRLRPAKVRGAPLRSQTSRSSAESAESADRRPPQGSRGLATRGIQDPAIPRGTLAGPLTRMLSWLRSGGRPLPKTPRDPAGRDRGPLGTQGAQSKDRRASSFRLLTSSFILAVVFFAATAGYSLFNYYADPAYAKAPDWRDLARFINSHERPGDVVVQNFTEMSAIYYLSSQAPVITVPKDFWPAPADEQTLRQVLSGYRRIWFIPAAPDFWDPNHFVENYLSRYSDREIDTRIASFQLQLYATPGEFEPHIVPVNARVGSATLVGYRIAGLAKGTMTTAGPLDLQVVLYWRPTAKIEKDRTVFVHLASVDERVLAQQDSKPVGGTYPTTQWKPGELIVDSYDLKADLAPGTYSLFVGMYDPATLVRVPAVDVNGASLPANRVLLTKITVVP